MFFQDNESKVDLLYYESTAKTIATLLKRRDPSPLSVGLHGTWGAGKSTILCQLEDQFSGDDFLCIRFNGWLFQGYDDARLVLLTALLSSVKKRLGVTETAKATIRSLAKRLNWLSVAKSVGSLGATVFTGVPIGALSSLGTGLSSLAEQFLASGKLDFKKISVTLPKDGLKLFDPQKATSVPEQIQAFRDEFASLLLDAKIERLVVLIDDLDRCLPESIVGILEAFKLFLFVDKTAFVIAADEAMIEYAVSKHFGGFQSTYGEMSYTRSYLEKIIQVPFRISNLGRIETSIYVSLLLLQEALEHQPESFEKVLQVGLESLKQPWLEQALDTKIILETLPHLDEVTELGVKAMMKISLQVSDTLAEGTRGNPRQIKRFLNSLFLRLQVAKNRGISDVISTTTLAKIMLAERFSEDLYAILEREASVHPDGLSSLLIDIEMATTQPLDDEKAREWASNAWVARWVQIEPSLKETDLRPYLFVSRDRKTFFDSRSIPDHLANLLTALLGPDMQVRSVENDLKTLGIKDAETLFGLLAAKIRKVEDFKLAPDGFEGLKFLVKCQLQLESGFLDLLKHLPPQKLGAWVVKGYAPLFEAQTTAPTFNQLKEQWKEKGSKALKAALKADDAAKSRRKR